MDKKPVINLYGVNEFGKSVLDDISSKKDEKELDSIVDICQLPISDNDSSDEAIYSTLNRDGDKCEMAFVIYEVGDNMSLARKVTESARKEGVFTVDVAVVPFLNDENKGALLGAVRGIQEYADGLLVMFSDTLAGMNGTLEKDIVKSMVSKSLCSLLRSFGTRICIEIDDLRETFQKGRIRYLGTGRGCGENRTDIALNGALSSIAFDSNLLFENSNPLDGAFAAFYGLMTLFDIDEIVMFLQERFEVNNVVFSMDEADTDIWEYMIIMPPIKGYLGCYDHSVGGGGSSSTDGFNFKFIDLD